MSTQNPQDQSASKQANQDTQVSDPTRATKPENQTEAQEAQNTWASVPLASEQAATDLHASPRSAFIEKPVEPETASAKLEGRPVHDKPVPSFLKQDLSSQLTSTSPHNPEHIQNEARPDRVLCEDEDEIARRHRAFLMRRLKASARRRPVELSVESGLEVGPSSQPYDPIDAYRQAEARLLRERTLSKVKKQRRTRYAAAVVAVLTLSAGAGSASYMLTRHGDFGSVAPSVRSALQSVLPGKQRSDEPVVRTAVSSDDKQRTASSQFGSKASLVTSTDHDKVAAAARGMLDGKPQPATTPISAVGPNGKTVTTTSLQVKDVTGQAGQPIKLSVAAIGLKKEDLAVRFVGLPREVKLTSGVVQPDGAWMLSATQVSDVGLVLPKGFDNTFSVSVEAVDAKSGVLAAPAQEMTVAVNAETVIVEPAAQPVRNSRNFAANTDNRTAPTVLTKPELPLAQPVPETFSGEQQDVDRAANPLPTTKKIAGLPEPTLDVVQGDPLDSLVSRGDDFLALGDVIAARRIYEMAVSMGARQAAAGMARTYDPVIFSQLGVRGPKPNAKTALKWYRKAKAAGDKSASESIETLAIWQKNQ